MKEYDQYRIELEAQDIEKILEQWAGEQLKNKGYELDYSQNVSDMPFPDMVAYRGRKI